MKEPESRWPFDSPEHRLIEKYIRVTRLHRSVIEHRLEGTGVYRSQHQILMFASHNPNVSQKDLAEMYGVSGATMAVLRSWKRAVILIGWWTSMITAATRYASQKRAGKWWRRAF